MVVYCQFVLPAARYFGSKRFGTKKVAKDCVKVRKCSQKERITVHTRIVIPTDLKPDLFQQARARLSVYNCIHFVIIMVSDLRSCGWSGEGQETN